MIMRHTEMTKPCIFRSNHVSNLLPVGGTLPMDKEKCWPLWNATSRKSTTRRRS